MPQSLSPDSSLAVSAFSQRLLRTSSLSDDVRRLRYVSGARAEALERLGIRTVRDLLLHVPRRYLDFSQRCSIAYADLGQTVTIVGSVDKVVKKRPRPRLTIVEVFVVDETGVIQAVFFRQPWIADQIHEGDAIAIAGKVGFSYGFKQMSSPFFEILDNGVSTLTPILPVHGVSEGMSAAWMRRIVSCALADRGDIADFIPAGLVARHGLMSEARALRSRHFPTSLAEAESARRRLAYDELVCLQLALLGRQNMECGSQPAHVHCIDGAHLERLRAALPFELTGEQSQAAAEILQDMAAPVPMARLLLGDVGTGKTAVAALALAAVADSGTQALMMAPTSVLAAQYATKLGPLLDEAGISWALLVGSTPEAERRRIYEGARTGEVQIFFGTTALLADSLVFRDVSLVVIDEQHRFGVDQRTALRRKGSAADLLAMSATPIPRTLALTLYGDMSCSRIVHRPRAGAGVSTKTITPENVDLAYGAIREACAQGQQAYVVCALIDESDSEAADMAQDTPEADPESKRVLSAARTTYERMRTSTFRDLRVGLLHGRMSAADKDEVMAAFRAGEIDVLVSTTVIEVGVDVPAATVMLILDADRFGLATLHQLRGRVGRGDIAGEVFLEAPAKRGSVARKRLSALEKTSDGFELAEMDLTFRNEGDVMGYRQHGGVTLHEVDLSRDKDLVSWAHDDARKLLLADPTLSGELHRALAYEVQDRFDVYFEEVAGA